MGFRLEWRKTVLGLWLGGKGIWKLWRVRIWGNRDQSLKKIIIPDRERRISWRNQEKEFYQGQDSFHDLDQDLAKK